MKTGRKVVALFLALLACGVLRAEAAERAAPPDKIRIAAFRGTTTALIHIAEEAGFFRRHGIEASVVVYDAGVTSLEDLVAGKIDVGTAIEFPFAVGRVPTDDLRIVSTIAATNNLELVVRTDRGIAKPSDCRGKRIGVMRGTFGEFFLNVFLSFNGVRAGDVKIVDLKPPEMEDALARNAVDGVIVWQPFIHQIKQKLGGSVVGWPAQGRQDSYALLVAREALARSRPAVIERLLRALVDAQDYAARHTPEAQSIVRRRFGYDAAFLSALWGKDRLEVQLTQDLLTLMDDEARWAVQNRVAEPRKMPNFLRNIYPDALKKIRPEAVTIQ